MNDDQKRSNKNSICQNKIGRKRGPNGLSLKISFDYFLAQNLIIHFKNKKNIAFNGHTTH